MAGRERGGGPGEGGERDRDWLGLPGPQRDVIYRVESRSGKIVQ
jgi:hypothetical protein